MELNLQNQRVLITGSSRGIGYAIAELFLREHAEVILTARNPEDLVKSAQRLEQNHSGRVSAHRVDFEQPAEIASLFAELEKKNKIPQHLVVNVGSGKMSRDLLPSISDWQKSLTTNLLSATETIRHFLNSKTSSTRSITLISSIAGLKALGAPTSYSAMKRALIGLTEDLAKNLASQNIRVNAIAPGNILFPGGRWEELKQANPADTEKMIQEKVPMQRFGSPEEVAALAVFLASEKAGFITGSVIKVDGGQAI